VHLVGFIIRKKGDLLINSLINRLKEKRYFPPMNKFLFQQHCVLIKTTQ